jgi:hypothetical protein
VIKSKNTKEVKTGINSDPINLKELDLTVVCHQRMTEWKKKNIKQILKDARLSTSFSESEIRLRN